MAGSWEALEKQFARVREITEKLTPPEPDDDFETERKAAVESIAKTEKYARIRHTGVPED